MANLIIFLATLTAFLLLVDASIYKTTVIVDEKNPRAPDDCREELMRQQNLKHCQEYIMQEASSSWDRLEINPREGEHFDRCCDQLREMSSMCRCYGLGKTVKRMPQERGLMGRTDMDQAMRMASSLPGDCGVEPSDCRFRSDYKRW